MAESDNVVRLSGPHQMEVAAGLVFRNGRVLIAQRPPGSHLGGYWEFPGGKREPGELWEACLLRELNEELGIQVEFLQWFSEKRHDNPNRSVFLRFGICRWLKSEPRAIGCSDFEWVDLQSIARYQFPEADGSLLNQLSTLEYFYQKSL